MSPIQPGEPQKGQAGPSTLLFLFTKKPGHQGWFCLLVAPFLQEWVGEGEAGNHLARAFAAAPREAVVVVVVVGDTAQGRG